MVDSTNPRVIADNIKELSVGNQANAGAIEANAEAIEALGAYSTDEIDTGMTWKGSKIFRKIFENVELPNSTTKAVAHGVSDLGVCTNLYAVIQAISGVYNGRLIGTPGAGTIVYSSTNIEIVTSTDLSAYSANIIFEYTKASPEP